MGNYLKKIGSNIGSNTCILYLKPSSYDYKHEHLLVFPKSAALGIIKASKWCWLQACFVVLAFLKMISFAAVPKK